VLLVLALALVGGAAWLWKSDSGMRWLLGQVPGLEAVEMRGRPSGGVFSVGQLRWQREGLRVEVDGLAWRDARWQWRPHPGAWLGISLDGAQVREVRVTTSPTQQPKEPGAHRRRCVCRCRSPRRGWRSARCG
jgi:translocation and assembly module TamB